jgi:purine-nucleoside phosphorylase
VSADPEMVGRAATLLRDKIGDGIETALILGSGLGGLVDRIEDPISIPYRAIPGFPPSTIPGHAARFVSGTLGARRVIVASGRYHLYEGHSPDMVAMPTRVLHACGVRTLFVSNAAGGINRTMRPGDLMIIEDQLNLMWRTPLAGALRRDETRFPDMSAPYDPVSIRILRDAALECGIPVTSGVYAGLIGPSYETPAEIRMLERLGADAVGMSTVPEVLAARALGMRVAGVSCITNIASGLSNSPLSHAEVLETAARSAERFEKLVIELVQRIARSRAAST